MTSPRNPAGMLHAGTLCAGILRAGTLRAGGRAIHWLAAPLAGGPAHGVPPCWSPPYEPLGQRKERTGVGCGQIRAANAGPPANDVAAEPGWNAPRRNALRWNASRRNALRGNTSRWNASRRRARCAIHWLAAPLAGGPAHAVPPCWSPPYDDAAENARRTDFNRPLPHRLAISSSSRFGSKQAISESFRT
jgi:hypothetical protein